MTWHTAFAQLDVALGGYFVINSIPQYPVLMDNVELASPQDLNFYSADMNWFVFNGAEDSTYPIDDGIAMITDVFAELDPSPTLQLQVLANDLSLN